MAAQPAVSATTLRLYNRLPEYLRLADAADTSTRGWPLLRYLSLTVDQVGNIETLLDRVDYVTVPDGGAPFDTSDLVDPATADAAWLPWLAQLVGVRAGDLSTSALRSAIANARAGWQVGSQGAVLALVKPFLTGTKRVDINRNVGGSQWVVQVLTYTTETPITPLAQLAQQYGSLAAVTAAYPTLGSIPNAAAAISAALALQKPAGVALTLVVADGAGLGLLHTDYPTLGALHTALPTLDAVRYHVPGS